MSGIRLQRPINVRGERVEGRAVMYIHMQAMLNHCKPALPELEVAMSKYRQSFEKLGRHRVWVGFDLQFGCRFG